MFYQILSYKAYGVNLNVKGNHAVVKCEDECCIQDAKFNCTYICKDDRDIKNIRVFKE